MNTTSESPMCPSPRPPSHLCGQVMDLWVTFVATSSTSEARMWPSHRPPSVSRRLALKITFVTVKWSFLLPFWPHLSCKERNLQKSENFGNLDNQGFRGFSWRVLDTGRAPKGKAGESWKRDNIPSSVQIMCALPSFCSIIRVLSPKTYEMPFCLPFF